MLGEHCRGYKRSVGLHVTFGDHALPFAEQIRQDARVSHADGFHKIGDAEADRGVAAMRE